MEALRVIRLRFLNITDEGVRLLAAKETLTMSLSLVSSNVTSESMHIIADSFTFR